MDISVSTVHNKRCHGLRIEHETMKSQWHDVGESVSYEEEAMKRLAKIATSIADVD